MRRDEIDALVELANLRIEEILLLLDIPYKDRYSYLVAPCPVHNGDNSSAWSFHLNKGMWRCFSRGCEEQYRPDVIGLIMGVKECQFVDALTFLRGIIQTPLNDEEIRKLKDQKANREFIEGIKSKAQDDIHFDPRCLSRLTYNEYLERRGYPRWLVEKYQIGACLEPKKYMSNRVVVPVINHDGCIVGFTGRTLDDDYLTKGIPKWKHSKGNWVHRNTFNANYAAQHIEGSSEAIITEGPLDVLRLEEAGVHNAVAILGKKLHGGQMTQLIEMGATKLVILLDNDKAGQSGLCSIKKSARCLFDIEDIKLPDGYKDVGEMPSEVIKEMFCATAV